MGKYEFDGDGDHKNDYFKILFSGGFVTDVWEISQNRKDWEDK